MIMIIIVINGILGVRKMKNQFLATYLLSPLFLTGILGILVQSNQVSAQEIKQYSIEQYSAELNQVTNVNQLRDVSPADWAYEALRSLVDRYGCIVGYPDQTFRAGKALMLSGENLTKTLLTLTSIFRKN